MKTFDILNKKYYLLDDFTYLSTFYNNIQDNETRKKFILEFTDTIIERYQKDNLNKSLKLVKQGNYKIASFEFDYMPFFSQLIQPHLQEVKFPISKKYAKIQEIRKAILNTLAYCFYY